MVISQTQISVPARISRLDVTVYHHPLGDRRRGLSHLYHASQPEAGHLCYASRRQKAISVMATTRQKVIAIIPISMQPDMAPTCQWQHYNMGTLRHVQISATHVEYISSLHWLHCARYRVLEQRSSGGETKMGRPRWWQAQIVESWCVGCSTPFWCGTDAMHSLDLAHVLVRHKRGIPVVYCRVCW
jgi:hypothetical protein